MDSFPGVSTPEYFYFTAVRRDSSATPYHHRRFFCGVSRHCPSAAWRMAVNCFRLTKATVSTELPSAKAAPPRGRLDAASLASAIDTALRAKAEHASLIGFTDALARPRQDAASYRSLYRFRYIR
jgi:hypothetical protein